MNLRMGFGNYRKLVCRELSKAILYDYVVIAFSSFSFIIIVRHCMVVFNEHGTLEFMEPRTPARDWNDLIFYFGISKHMRSIRLAELRNA